MKVTPTRTYSPKPGDADKKWYVTDATDAVLGRLTTKVAGILCGKHKPTSAPHMDMGNNVIIINADKVVLTGKKLEQKMTYRHSGHPDGLTAVSYRDLMANSPERAVEKAVRGMLSHTSLGHAQFRKLHVYVGAEHPHAGQSPVPYEITQVAQWASRAPEHPIKN